MSTWRRTFCAPCCSTTRCAGNFATLSWSLRRGLFRAACLPRISAGSSGNSGLMMSQASAPPTWTLTGLCCSARCSGSERWIRTSTSARKRFATRAQILRWRFSTCPTLSAGISTMSRDRQMRQRSNMPTKRRWNSPAGHRLFSVMTQSTCSLPKHGSTWRKTASMKRLIQGMRRAAGRVHLHRSTGNTGCPGSRKQSSERRTAIRSVSR